MLLLIDNRSVLQSSKLQHFYSTMYLLVFTFCYSLHSKQVCVFILTVVIPAAAPVISLQLDLFSQQLYLPLLLIPYLRWTKMNLAKVLVSKCRTSLCAQRVRLL